MIEGIIFAIISMIGYGLYQYFLKGSKNNIYSNLIYVHSTLVILGLFLLFFSKPVIPDLKTSLFILSAGIVGAINIPFLYKAIKDGKLSLVIPIANTYALPSVIFSYLFFGEVLSLSKYVAGAIIIFGVILIVLKREEIKNFKIDKEDIKPIIHALIFAFGLGLWNNLLKPVTLSIGPYLGFLYVEASILICLLLVMPKYNFQKPKKFSPLALAGFFQFIGGIFFFIGIKYVGVSITSMIGGANPLIVLILAFVFLKERIEWNQLLGVLITIIGLIGLVI